MKTLTSSVGSQEVDLVRGSWRQLFERHILCQTLEAHAVILATQEAEIRRILFPSQPREIVQETLSLSRKKPSQKRADGVAQDEGPEFKPQHCKKKKKKGLACPAPACPSLLLSGLEVSRSVSAPCPP
jgi:hypothetical protein